MTREQKILLGGAVATILAFLIGFGWQYTRASRLDQQLATTRTDLTFERLESTIAAATVEAYRGNYEIARKLASDFFTGLQNELMRAPEEHRTELNAINNQRDAIITAASRSDPQTPNLLGQLYSTYRVAFGDAPVTPQPAPMTPPTTTTSQ